MPIASKNPYEPTIIIIEDEHGGNDDKTGWKVEFERLEILRQKFGFNFVGIEGWAGHEVDKKRGRSILNAEVQLIKKLINDSNYKVVGLENEQLQIEALELLLLIFFIYEENHRKALIGGLIKYVKEDLLKELLSKIRGIVFHMITLQVQGKNPTDIERAKISLASEIQTFMTRFVPENLRQNFLSFFNIYFYWIERMFEGMIEIYDITKFSEEYFNKTRDSLFKKYSAFESEIRNKIEYFEDSDSYEKKEIEEFFQNIGGGIMMPKRERAAVTRMINAMKENKQRVGIVVFGEHHSLGLIKEFTKQSGQNINIIVLQEFHVYLT